MLGGPSKEMITSSKCAATLCAYFLRSNPVVKRVSRMPSVRKIEQTSGSSAFIKGSPPENTTHLTLKRRIESSWRFTSSTPNTLCTFAFQMSHITQRQLHELCAWMTRIGRVSILWGAQACSRGRNDISILVSKTDSPSTEIDLAP